ncbi:MAG: GtrA family protein [Candidatus Pacearchaeota archaeon]|nr:MAG: GtrA family protein [Candidatus Pacearchaeota archaeon]
MLSIILPTKNEATNIRNLFNRISRIKKKIGDFEIILVDSDSKDNTIKVAKNFSRVYKLKVQVFNSGKKDLSNSVLVGLKKAKGSIVCIMDSDLQHPPEMIPLMIKTLNRENADIIIASRFVKGSKLRFGPWRIFVSKVYCLLAHLFIPKSLYIKDPATGFFVFRKKILKKARLRPLGFKILLEILARAKYDKVIEVPFSFKERREGKSKFNFKQTFMAFRHLLRLAKSGREHYRFLKFCAVGASGIVVNEGLLWLLTEFAGLFYLISGAIAIESSILSNFILNDLWTFRKERKGKYLKRLLRFNVARIFALGINFSVLLALTSLGVHYLISNLFGIVLATMFTYLSSLWWVWK